MKPSSLSVKNFRSLVDVTLRLPALTVMIGPNGAGKTALLEVFQLLQRASQLELARFLEGRGGILSVLNKEAVEREESRLTITLELDAQSKKSDQPMLYCLELSAEALGYAITTERLSWHTKPWLPQPLKYIDADRSRVQYYDPMSEKLSPPNWEYVASEPALAQVPRMYQEPEQLRNLFASTAYYGFLDVGPKATVRLPQSLAPILRPGPNGENLYSTLYNVRAMYPEIYDRIEAVLQQAFPNFSRIEFPVVGAGQVTLAWYERSFRNPLYPNQLSEGTLRFLWLITVLLAPAGPALTLIDEPEVSLHPELLKLLAALLQDTSAARQILVATHAPDLIHWLEPDEVLVVDKVAGRTSVTRAGEMDIEHWLEEYTLSELWRMGNLGGRP